MTTFQLLLVCITVLLLAKEVATVFIVRADLQRERAEEHEAPARINHRVTVHTKQPDDQTIFGVLVGDYDDRLVLEAAEYVTPLGTKPIPARRHEIATRDVAWIDIHDLVVTASAPSLAAAPAAAEEA